MEKLRIDVWSDVVCPWCYVGKRRLERAIERCGKRDAIEVVWRAFELDPSAPRERDRAESYAERLAKKYRRSVSEAEGMIARMTELARADGLFFDFGRIRPGNTFDAHRVLHFARERGLQDAVKERLFRGYFVEGEAIGNHDVIVRLAGETGLSVEEVHAVLATDAHAADVRADEQAARDLGIDGVPFFVIADRYAVSGAQPTELFLQAIERASREIEARDQTSESAPALAEGAACGPDGCG